MLTGARQLSRTRDLLYARGVAINPDLEARILGNPDDSDAYAVYGDWLSEQGDPRGELVAIQRKLAESDDPALRAREAKLLADHGKTWLGELHGLDPKKDFAVTWHNGFLATARIGPPVEAYATSEIDFPGTLAKLVALPGITFLRSLVIGAKDHDDYPTMWSDSVDAIAAHGVPAGLQHLEFNRGGYWDISQTMLGKLAPAYPKLARLRSLRIELGGFELDTIELPELRSLELVTGGLTKENVESIRTGILPRLESLLLCIGTTDGDYGCTVALDDLGWIFAGEGLTDVRHLGLANASFADELAGMLPSSKILPRLASLDVSRGTMSDAGAQLLLDHAAAFAHLTKLDLSRNFFSAEVKAKLEQLPNVVVADNQGADDDYRYVAIGE
jgi:uncharacterized protein (TIGR02996 family)